MPSSSFPNATAPPQRAERAERVPDSAWEEHRETIKRLYIDSAMKLEVLVAHMEEHHGFTASEQQYKVQFNKWGLRKNKRRMDQRISSPETEQPARPPPSLRSTDQVPHSNNYLDLNFMGPISASMLPHYSNPMGGTHNFGQNLFHQPTMMSLNNIGGTQAFWQDPFAQPAMNLNLQPYAGQFASAYAQQSSPSMHGQFQQLGPQATPPVGQNHFQLSRYNHSGGGGSAASQISRGIAAAAVKASRQPIHLAAQSGFLRGTKLLVDANPECVHVLDDDGLGPAWFAAQGGHTDILALLIAHHVDLNAPSRKFNLYPIHQAARSGHKKAVELLLQNGADPDPADSEGVTPLWLAAQGGHHEIMGMILERETADKKVNLEVEWGASERRPLHQAAQNGHLETARLLLAKGAAYDPMDSDGVTPLWLGSGNNANADLLRELLEAGARVDVMPYEHNRQPIHQAAVHGSVEAVRLLLDAGASPTPENDTFDGSEISPFLLACGSGKVESVNIFLDRGVDAHMTSKNGKSALHYAAHGGYVAIAQVLIDKGCDVDAREEDGWPPMMIAAQEGHLSFVDLLMKNNANIDAEEKDGATSLWIAAQQGHVAIVKSLLEAGAKQLSIRSSGRRPIHQAAQSGHLACVKQLVKHSPEEINKCDSHGFTALTHASQKNETAHLSVMRYLVSRGAKVTL